MAITIKWASLLRFPRRLWPQFGLPFLVFVSLRFLFLLLFDFSIKDGFGNKRYAFAWVRLRAWSFFFGWVLVGFGLCRRNRDWCCSVCFLGCSRGVYRPRLDLHVEVRKKPLFSPFNECQITHTQCGLPLYYIVLCLFGQIMQIAWQQWRRNIQVAKSILVRMSYSTREAA